MVKTCEVWDWLGRSGSETSPERICLELAGNSANQVLTKKSCLS